MGADVVGTARALFAGGFDHWPGDAFALLAEDVVINSPDGHIYVGHKGFARWYEEAGTDCETYDHVPAGTDVVRENWVLLKAGPPGGSGAGEQGEEPGCWLVHVRNGLIAALLHYRSEDDARDALAGAQ